MNIQKMIQRQTGIAGLTVMENDFGSNKQYTIVLEIDVNILSLSKKREDIVQLHQRLEELLYPKEGEA